MGFLGRVLDMYYCILAFISFFSELSLFSAGLFFFGVALHAVWVDDLNMKHFGFGSRPGSRNVSVPSESTI